jgi:hypothetical protein
MIFREWNACGNGGKEMSPQYKKVAAHQLLRMTVFFRRLNACRGAIKEMSSQCKKVAEGMKCSDKKLFIFCHS